MEEKSKRKITVAVGMSGGVDSSVCAYLLKKQGYRVIGIFMKNWDDSDDPHCPAKQDYEDVISVCNSLDIPFYSVNFSEEYYQLVFQDLLDGLKKGVTPNPDVLCNKVIKFDALLNKALAIGADFLATGHYAKIGTDSIGPLLRKASDTNKDQTYFLYTLQSEILKKVLFPLSDLSKPQVREIAKEMNLDTYNKKDSTGICFIGKRNFKSFIEEYIPHKPGKILSIEGDELGMHDGLYYYTIGQRKGLKIGGAGPAWFVAKKDMSTNTLYLAQGEDHPALYAKNLLAISPSWVANTFPHPLPFKCTAKLRHRQKEQECIIEAIDNEEVKVSFLEPQKAITPSQSIVFYDRDICLGGAIIKEAGPSLFE